MSLFTDALQFHAAFLWMPLALEDMVSSDRACPGLAGLSQGLERLSQPVGLDAGGTWSATYKGKCYSVSSQKVPCHPVKMHGARMQS